MGNEPHATPYFNLLKGKDIASHYDLFLDVGVHYIEVRFVTFQLIWLQLLSFD